MPPCFAAMVSPVVFLLSLFLWSSAVFQFMEAETDLDVTRKITRPGD